MRRKETRVKRFYAQRQFVPWRKSLHLDFLQKNEKENTT